MASRRRRQIEAQPILTITASNLALVRGRNAADSLYQTPVKPPFDFCSRWVDCPHAYNRALPDKPGIFRAHNGLIEKLRGALGILLPDLLTQARVAGELFQGLFKG